MAKPWAKYEVDFINHTKFRALNANAICLWIEGKNYCDLNMTDGLIPAHVVKQFRFSGKKAIESLLTAMWQKNESFMYAPLWEIHPVGYKMHDYLEYNDCRKVVLERMKYHQDRREEDKNRKAVARRAKAAKAAAVSIVAKAGALSAALSATCPQDVRTDVRTMSADCPPHVLEKSASMTATAIEVDPPLVKNTNGGGEAPPALPPRPMSPIHDRSHRTHAICGRVCLHASLFNDFVRRRNHDGADQEIRTWAGRVIDAWTLGEFQAVEPGDPFDFWKARYAEQWPAAAVSSSKLPAWAQKKAQA